jgi:hypothetical protein
MPDATPADDFPLPDARIRVAAAAAIAIQTPFRDAAGRPDPEAVDMPALAMATVAAPVAVAIVGRFLEGVAAGGIPAGLAFACAGALVAAVMASLAILTLWAIEAIARRTGWVQPPAIPRAYRYALAFLATIGLPHNVVAVLCILALGVATLVGSVRRLKAPVTPERLVREMAPPALGFLAFQVAMTIFLAVGLHLSLVRLVAGAFSAAFG